LTLGKNLHECALAWTLHLSAVQECTQTAETDQSQKVSHLILSLRSRNVLNLPLSTMLHGLLFSLSIVLRGSLLSPCNCKAVVSRTPATCVALPVSP